MHSYLLSFHLYLADPFSGITADYGRCLRSKTGISEACLYRLDALPFTQPTVSKHWR